MAELFSDFEINRQPRWPRLLRLTSGSLVLHAIILGCVLYVPEVREALKLASMFSGVKYVNQDYKVTMIEDSAAPAAHEKFQYPEGYFLVTSNQVMFAENGEPQPLPTPDTAGIKIVQMYKPEKEQPEPSFTPTPIPTPSSASSPATGASPKPSPSSSPSVQELAEKRLQDIETAEKVKRPRTINKKPFVDWLANAKKMKDAGELDLSGTVDMIIEADRDADGKLHNVRVVQKAGDAKLTELAKQLVSALSDSGGLDFLEGADHLVMEVKFDQTSVSASASTQVESEARASQLSRVYNAYLVFASLTKSGHDEEQIFKRTSVSADGKQVTVKFGMPRSVAGALLAKQVPAS